MCIENYKLWLKEIKGDLNKWKDILCSWIGRFFIKMSILPKATYRFNKISIKIPTAFLQKCGNANPQIHLEFQGALNSQTNLEKKKSNGQVVFDESAKSIQWGKDSLFSRWCWCNGIFTCKRMKLDAYFIPYTINSKWIDNLNTRAKTIKLLEENRGKSS